VLGGLVRLVADRLELERAVRDVEMAAEALAQPVQHLVQVFEVVVPPTGVTPAPLQVARGGEEGVGAGRPPRARTAAANDASRDGDRLTAPLCQVAGRDLRPVRAERFCGTVRVWTIQSFR